jgi:hypothetical protein
MKIEATTPTETLADVARLCDGYGVGGVLFAKMTAGAKPPTVAMTSS